MQSSVLWLAQRQHKGKTHASETITLAQKQININSTKVQTHQSEKRLAGTFRNHLPFTDLFLSNLTYIY